MGIVSCQSPKFSWIRAQMKQKYGPFSYHFHSLLSSTSTTSPSLPYNSDYQKQAAPSSSSGNKISPAVLFIIVILAVIFFISGLLHLLVRFLIKHRSSSSSASESSRYREMSGSEAFQRQLQQLFHLHDSGLDQAFIDALPVFLYKEVMGLKEPFDCAVCLCEFSEQDKLRLLPMCSHAFHIDCIDTWLLSNSTCPLCRGTLFTPGLHMENPIFDFEIPREEDMLSSNGGSGISIGPKPSENEIISGKRVFSIRLGKFRCSNNEPEEGEVTVRGEGETSSSNLDTRRCYSMGSYQYIVADSELQVAFCPSKGGNCGASMRFVSRGQTGNSLNDGEAEGKKINIRSKGESFSVSKIWQWSKKQKLQNPADAHIGSSYVSVSLPWTDGSRSQVS